MEAQNMWQKKLLGEDDDFWEPYSDVVGNWTSDVWENLDAERMIYVRDYIKSNILANDEIRFIPNDIDRMPEDFEGADEDGYVLMTPEILDQLDNDELGMLVKEDDDFDELKKELRWSYEEAYNTAVRDEWYDEYTDAIIDIIGSGKPEWVKNGTQTKSKYTDQNGKERVLVNDNHDFVFPNIKFFELMKTWAENNLENDVSEFEYSSYVRTVENLLEENGDQLSPNPSEWPDDEKVIPLFNEAIPNRF